jgi:hypothetical protein
MLMKLRKSANSLVIQVQSDVAREIFPTRVTHGLISNTRGTVEKSLFVLVKRPTKQVPCLMWPTPPSGWQAQGFKISIANKIK